MAKSSKFLIIIFIIHLGYLKALGQYSQPSNSYGSPPSASSGGYPHSYLDYNQNITSSGGYSGISSSYGMPSSNYGLSSSSYGSPSSSYGGVSSSGGYSSSAGTSGGYLNDESSLLDDTEDDDDSTGLLPIVLLVFKLIKKFVKKLKIVKILKVVKLIGGILLPELALPLGLILLAPILIPIALILLFLLPIPIITVPSGSSAMPIIGMSTTTITPSSSTNAPIGDFRLNQNLDGESFLKSSRMTRLAKMVLSSEKCLEKIFCELEFKEGFKSRDSLDRVDIWINSAIESSPDKETLRKRVNEAGNNANCSIYPCKKFGLVRKSLHWK